MTGSSQVRFDEMLEKLRATSLSKGDFDFRDEKPLLSAVIRINNVTDGFGVYIIYGKNNGQKCLLYIGKSGTIHNDGKLGVQGINKRLNKKQEGISRNIYFREVINGAHSGRGPFEKLQIEWFETYKEGAGTPPFLVEAQLMAQYLAENETLPPLNKEV